MAGLDHLAVLLGDLGEDVVVEVSLLKVLYTFDPHRQETSEVLPEVIFGEKLLKLLNSLLEGYNFLPKGCWRSSD